VSFTSFASNLYAISLDQVNEAQSMGSFQETLSGELKYIRSAIYIENVSSLGGSERMRIKIYSDSSLTGLLYTSEWSNISSITNLGSTNWLGWIRFDFNKENINKNLIYYAKIETDNYTSGISVLYDFPFAVYDNGEDIFQNRPIMLQIFTYKDLS
jgi:hypothetical protein